MLAKELQRCPPTVHAGDEQDRGVDPLDRYLRAAQHFRVVGEMPCEGLCVGHRAAGFDIGLQIFEGLNVACHEGQSLSVPGPGRAKAVSSVVGQPVPEDTARRSTDDRAQFQMHGGQEQGHLTPA